MKISDIFVGIFGSIIVHAAFLLLMTERPIDYTEYLLQLLLNSVF